MVTTRTLFAAVVAGMGIAGSANAQSVSITSVGYVAANPPYPATTQPSGTFNLPPNARGYPDYRVCCDYGSLDPNTGKFVPYTTGGNTSVTYSQVIAPGMGGTFNWAIQGTSGWPSPPTQFAKVRARLQRRVSYTGNPAVDWQFIANVEDIKSVI